MTRSQKIGVVVVSVVFLALLLALGAGIFNYYKESQFAERQTVLQKQLADEKANAQAKQALADRAAEEGRQKDAEITQLKAENALLAQQAETKRIVYVNSRKPVPIRPYNGSITDEDVRSAATRAGLVIRSAP